MTQADMAAQTAGFTGRGNFQTICGQAAVFIFQGGGEDEEIQVEMAVDPPGSANFSVFTTQQWTNMSQGGDATAMGSGTANEQRNGNLFWQGSTPERGDFYVVVQPTTQNTSRFWLNVEGTGASNLRFQPAGGQAAPAQAQQPAATPATAAQAQGQQAGPTRAATAQAQQGVAPGTLPVTGGTVMGLLIAGAAMFVAGWWTRRRAG
jgi:hypothetical protein